MRLYGSPRSPYARKVMVAAHELGLAGRITQVHVVVSTTHVNAELARHNPLGQIPTLVLDDGTILCDSLVICEYLDGVAGRAALFPVAPPQRSDALTRHALGHGVMDTLVRLFGERRRVDDPLQPVYVKAFRDKFHRVLDAWEARCAGTGCRHEPAIDIGDIAMACALSYADFRFDEEHWRDARPALAAWHALFAQRPAMRATEYSAPAT